MYVLISIWEILTQVNQIIIFVDPQRPWTIFSVQNLKLIGTLEKAIEWIDHCIL